MADVGRRQKVTDMEWIVNGLELNAQLPRWRWSVFLQVLTT